jgi:hypothetical protein
MLARRDNNEHLGAINCWTGRGESFSYCINNSIWLQLPGSRFSNASTTASRGHWLLFFRRRIT